MKWLHVLLVSAVAACATTTDPPGPAPVTETTATTPVDAGAPKPDAGPKSDPVTTKGECGGEKTQTACVDCCSKAHEDGAITYIGAVMDCACQPSTCQTACEPTFCNDADPKEPDAACNACIQASSCQVAISKACAQDPDCVAFNTCLEESVCLSKK